MHAIWAAEPFFTRYQPEAVLLKHLDHLQKLAEEEGLGAGGLIWRSMWDGEYGIIAKEGGDIHKPLKVMTLKRVGERLQIYQDGESVKPDFIIRGENELFRQGFYYFRSNEHGKQWNIYL